jgi:hypothetical protein
MIPISIFIPLNPQKYFLRLSESNNKFWISVVSILVTLIFTLVFYYLNYPFKIEPEIFAKQLIAYSIGFIFKMLILGVLLAVLIHKVFKKKLSIKLSIAIVVASSFPLVLNQLMPFISKASLPFAKLVAYCFFCLLIGIGFSVAKQINVMKLMTTAIVLLAIFELVGISI